jgi:hypothetical protein
MLLVDDSEFNLLPLSKFIEMRKIPFMKAHNGL